MDEMVLRSKFMRNIVAKLITRELTKKGFTETGLTINELSIQTKEDGVVGLHLDIDATVPVSTITKLLNI